MKTNRIIIAIGYITVFIIGLYIGQGSPYIPILQIYGNNSMNISDNLSFTQIGIKYKTDKVTDHRYDTMYEKYLRKYRGSNVTMLEIGLGCQMPYGPGASAYLWREYLGPHATIHFIEFQQKCGEEWYNNSGVKLNVKMHYGNQEDITFLNTVNSAIGYFDIIIDDGGHSMKQQITSLIHLFPKVRSGGVYVIEDLHTSYFSDPDSGYLVNTTTIEFLKRLIDDIQAESPRKSTEIGPTMFSFEISNKICIINKK